MKTPSEMFDLLDRRDGSHVHHKSVAFACIVATIALIWTNLLFGDRPITTAEAFLLGFLVSAAYGTGLLKAIIGLGHSWLNRGKQQ